MHLHLTVDVLGMSERNTRFRLMGVTSNLQEIKHLFLTYNVRFYAIVYIPFDRHTVTVITSVVYIFLPVSCHANYMLL